MIEPLAIRSMLLDTLQVYFIGPYDLLRDHFEFLPHAPSRWYLTGFLVPTDADEAQCYDLNRDGEVDSASSVAKVDANQSPE
jgi:hypothetical protein